LIVLARIAIAIAAAALIGGCVPLMPNPRLNDARALVEQDKVEDAIAAAEALLRDDPTNAEFRAFVARQRELGVIRFLTQGDFARAAGALDEAETAYRRVLRLEPGNTRALASIDALQADRRGVRLLAEAEAALGRGDAATAETRVAAILAESPRHRGALVLQRKLAERRAFAAPVTPELGPGFHKPISVEFRDASLRQVFEALARSHDVNFVFDKDVRPDIRVTIFVRNTSIDEVVSLILATNQLARKVLGPSSVLVYPNTPAKQREYQEMVVRSFYLGNADPKQALALVKTMVKTRDVFIDEKVNLLVMRDTPEAVRLAEKLIARQDVAEPEVMLELEVLEVARGRLSELGIKYPTQINYGPTGSDGGTPPSSFAFSSSQLIATVANPAFVINLKLQDSLINVLANPRIRVRNRDKARVHIGEKVPVITTTSTANVGVSASVSYLEVGLKLDVEPDIHLDDEVAMKVGLEVSNILETIDLLNTRAYRLGSRNASTVLRLKDGETQVLAGLITDDDRSTASKVPGLGELPVVGRLFSSTNAQAAKTEIVLLITPRVVRNIVRPDLQTMEFAGGTDAAVGAPPLRLSTALSGGVSLASRQGGGPAPSETAPQGRVAFVPPAPSPGTDAPAQLTADPAAAPGKPQTLTLNAPAQAALGAAFSVSLGLPAGVAARSAEFDFIFDPAVLQLIGVAGDGGQPVTVVPAAPGRVTLRLQAASPGTMGQVAMQFRVISAVPIDTQLSVSTGSVVDPQGGVVAISPLPPHRVALGR